jgi:hypothetical protein
LGRAAPSNDLRHSSGNQAIIKKIKYYQKLLGDLRGLNSSSNFNKSRRRIIQSMSPMETKINNSASFVTGKNPIQADREINIRDETLSGYE